MATYSLSDFENIKSNGFTFKFTDQTLLLLKAISTHCNTPTPPIEVVFKKDVKWERLASLQKTVIKPEQNATEKKINSLLSHINKLSNTNYDNIKKSIFIIIQELIESDYDLSLIIQKIFDLISVNKFYSSMYSTLYSDLNEQWPQFSSILPNELTKYIESLELIETCDPNDYDLFCKINMANEKRRSKTLFIINLIKNNIIPKHHIQEIINLIIETITQLIPIDNKQYRIEELTEYLFILTTEGKDFYDVKLTLHNIKYFTTLDIKKTKSLNNKSLFKCKDILDFFSY
jgi:hypothetical protein